MAPYMYPAVSYRYTTAPYTYTAVSYMYTTAPYTYTAVSYMYTMAPYTYTAVSYMYTTAPYTHTRCLCFFALTPSPSPTGWERGVGAHGGAPCSAFPLSREAEEGDTGGEGKSRRRGSLCELPSLRMRVDLRSDTVTLPTPEMRRAMANAELGDDVYGEDPTVNRLQERVAELLGHEAALFTPSGTMANEIAVKVWTQPGDAILVDAESHILHYELAAPAVIAGVQVETYPIADGVFHLADIESRIRRADDHTPGTRLLCVENTHNRCGGTILPPEVMPDLRALADRHGLRLHLDGARLFNASVALGVSAQAWTRDADSVMVAFSKGLCCPVGSVLAGSAAFIREAHRVRKMLGGGMRQAGVLAAACLVALDTMIDRLAEDHARAKRLAEAIAELPGFSVNLRTVQTNMVYVQTARPAQAVERALAAEGVLCIALDPHRLRLVTHKDIDDAAIEHAIRAFRRVSGILS
jgi:threonine aldolase